MLELEKIPRENLVGPGSLSILVCFLNLSPVGNQSVMGLDVVGLECCDLFSDTVSVSALQSSGSN